MVSVYFVDLCKFLALVGSVLFVDFGLDPLWGPSTLWTRVLILRGVRPRYGRVGSVHFVDLGLDPVWGPSRLWTRVLTLRGVRPRYGLMYVFYPCGVRPRCGLV